MNSTIYSQIGLRVRQLRRQQHRSQDELSVWLRAFHAPITRDMIANWETGPGRGAGSLYSSSGLRAQGRGDGYSAPPDLKGFESRPDHARVPPPARAATNPSISHHRRMNVTAQQTEFLSWKVVPARLDATQAAWFLGFEPHEIPRLVTAGLLKPLGHPARNSTKFFATETLEQFRRDEKWLARASDAIASYWRERNARKQQARGRA